MTETELNQINPTEGRPKLRSSLPDDNLNSHITSDIPPDKATQNISPDKDEIEPIVLNQIQR